LITARRSVRRFANIPVPDDKLQAILEAVARAPTAGNLQAYHVFVVRNEECREDLAAASRQQMFVAEAPVVLVFCAQPERSAPRYADRGRRLYCLQDATIACTYAMLAATEEGLATVWIGAFDDDEVAACIDAPDGLHPVAVLPIGYAAEAPDLVERRAISEFTTNI
jgi:nitroreductase